MNTQNLYPADLVGALRDLGYVVKIHKRTPSTRGRKPQPVEHGSLRTARLCSCKKCGPVLATYQRNRRSGA